MIWALNFRSGLSRLGILCYAPRVVEKWALSENLGRPNKRARFREGLFGYTRRNARQRIHENPRLAGLPSVPA